MYVCVCVFYIVADKEGSEILKEVMAAKCSFQKQKDIMKMESEVQCTYLCTYICLYVHILGTVYIEICMLRHLPQPSPVQTHAELCYVV